MRYRHSAFFYAFVQPLLRALWLGPTYYLRLTRPVLSPRTRVLILTDTHVLLIKNVVGSRQWTLPGGGYHANESGEQCAKREVREELGITLTHLQPIGAVNELSRGATWNYDCFVSHLDEISEIHLSIELSDAQWFAVANLPITIRPYARKLIEQYAGPHSPIE